MSHRSVSGLVGVSAKTSGCWAARRPSRRQYRSAATKVVSTPKRAISVPSSLMVEPNMDCEQITWSPAFSAVSATSKMADMPVDGGHGAFGAFHGGQALFKAGDGGVAGAAVGKAALPVGKATGRGGAVGLHKAAGHVQRFAVLSPTGCGAGPGARPGFRDADLRECLSVTAIPHRLSGTRQHAAH